MTTEQLRLILIGLALVGAGGVYRRVVHGPWVRGPAWATVCRGMILLGYAGWVATACGLAALAYAAAPPLVLLLAVAAA